jgi:hypothetical protein
MYCMCQGSVVDPHRFNEDPGSGIFPNCGSGSGSSSESRVSMAKNWKKFTAEKNGYFFDKKLQFSYHKASIKDAQAKGEAI